MTIQEGVDLLTNTALKGEKSYHPGYEWTCDYADDLKAYFAGVDIDDYLKQFARRESKELFEQRKTITAEVQSALGNMLDTPFAKIRRSNWVQTLTFDKDPEGAKAKAFQKRVLDQWPKKGLNDYVFERLRYWNKFDPNCFIVVEFKPFDPKIGARPYPFEVTAEMAANFSYDEYGVLQYLIARQEIETDDDTPNEVCIERLTIYMANQTIVLQQLTKAEIEALASKPAKSEKIALYEDGALYAPDDNRVYQLSIPLPHNYPKVPAIRAGYIDNPEDDGATCLSIFHAGLPFAKKLIKVNSEVDIVTALLAFPVTVRHEESCDAVGCMTGRLADGSTCMSCRGTGLKQRPTSAQEEIVLPLPTRAEDQLDINQIITYTYPPTDAVRLQIEIWEGWMQRCLTAVFNSQMFTKQQTAQTATYHGIELQSVYDTLHPYAEHISDIWAYLLDVNAAFTGYIERPFAALIFPHDFRFETADDLFAELKSARDAGAGNDAGAILQSRIMERLLIDDAEGLKRWRVDSMFDPFRGMTENEILAALNSDLVPKWKKVYYTNKADIMVEILQATPDFYKLAYPLQSQLIRDKVQEIQDQIAASAPALNLNALNTQPANANANPTIPTT